MENTENKKAKVFISKKDAAFREFALNGNMWQVLIQVCVPLAAYAFLNAIFNILDTLMASNLGSMEASTVAYLLQIKNIVSAVGGGLATGGTLKISEAYGAGDYELVKKRVSTQVLVSGILAVLVLSMTPFTGIILTALGTPKEFVEMGTQYFTVTLISVLVGLFNGVYISIERARGNTKRIMRLNLMVIVIKLTLTAFFIYVMNGGLVMIAVASLIAQIVLLFIALYNLFKGADAFSFSMGHIGFKNGVYLPIVKVSYPVIIEKMAFAYGKAVVNQMCSIYGSTTVGALGISNNMDGLVTQLQIGFQDGGSAVISQNLGAGKPKRALEAFYKLMIINALIGLAGLIILNLLADPIAYLFAFAKGKADPEFQQLIVHIFRYESFGSCIQLGIYDAVMALLFGFKKTKLVLLTNVLRVFVFRIPVLWALQNFTNLGSECAGIIMGVSNTLTMIAGLVVAYIVVKQEKRKIEAENITI